ncbi:hypothetical protein AGMMS50296_7650 [Alphaproteobacteria bacterium]|nr:hypothetical protein AGMMS50296_7650 [Alphaproteobacteria bacterium]
MAHSIKLSDKAYQILSAIAEEEGRSVTKQIEIWAKRFEKTMRHQQKEDFAYNNLSSRESYEEAERQVKKGDVVYVGKFKTIEELDEKLGV